MAWRRRKRQPARRSVVQDAGEIVIGKVAGGGSVGDLGAWPVDDYAGSMPGGLNPPADIYAAPNFLPVGQDEVDRGFPAPMERGEATVVPWRLPSGGVKPDWQPFPYRTPFPAFVFDNAPHVGTVRNPAASGHYYRWPAPILDTRLLHLVPYRVPQRQSRGVPYAYPGAAAAGYTQTGPDAYGW